MGEVKKASSPSVSSPSPAAEIALPSFVASPAAAASLSAAAGSPSLPALLPLLIPSIQRQAVAPISSFPVGAAALGASGAIYAGVNLEFPGLPLHQTVHAEQFAVASAAAAGERAISHIAVSHVPCGHCRQFLQELRCSGDLQILVTSDGDGSTYRPLSDLLPRPFGPQDLLDKSAALLLDPHDNGELGDLIAVPAVAGGEMDGRLCDAAAAAARASHAPYSGCPAGFAVVDGEGGIYAGGYIESAAYNPSIGPVQAAMVDMAVKGRGGRWGEIVAAAVVEREDAAVAQEATARAFLAAVAPPAALTVWRFRPPSE